MKTKTRLSVSLTCFALACQLVHGASNSVVEFDSEETRDLGWSVVDDGVMGGLSKGNLAVTDDGVLKFSGNLSLENNGGFSSLRTGDVKFDLSGAEGLVARVKGDGRTYQMRFGTDARYREMEVSFMAEFPTEKDKWTEVRIPFDKFEGSFRGMKLENEKFDPAKISRLGLLLGDKKEGPFELQADWIRTYGAEASGPGDIVELALADGRFKTLAAALTAVELVEVLKGKGPFTVFAPTDSAFAKLPTGTVEDLLKPENRDKLEAVLKFHVIAGEVGLAAALGAGKAKTVLGEALEISFSKGQVKVNDAALIDADVRAANGVIHVIDSVLLPPAPKNDIASVAKRTGQFNTLIAAVEAADLGDALSGNAPLTILAPTDAAFKALPKGTIESLLEPANRDKLRKILMLHVVSGKVSAGDALNAKSAKALSGGTLAFGIDEGKLKVNGATIMKTDIVCDNGVIHVIDAVLLPPVTEKGGDGGHGETSMSPTERIQAAIQQGVPVFNEGDHGKCAAIYQECLMALAKDERLDRAIRLGMRDFVERAGKLDNDTAKAWLLRSGLDHVHAALVD